MKPFNHTSSDPSLNIGDEKNVDMVDDVVVSNMFANAQSATGSYIHQLIVMALVLTRTR
jgi:hypothetical protein